MSVVISKCKLWPPLPHRPGPHKLCPHTSFYYGHRATIIVLSASIFPRLMNDRREVFSNLFMVCIGGGEGGGQVWELIRGLASAPGFQQNVICYKFSPRSIVFFLVANFAKWVRTGATGPAVPWRAVRVALAYSSLASRFTIIFPSFQLLTNIFRFYVTRVIKAYINQWITNLRNIWMAIKILVKFNNKDTVLNKLFTSYTGLFHPNIFIKVYYLFSLQAHN